MDIQTALTKKAEIGDYFDRQKRIPDWNQKNIENQVCLILGVGGIGCSTSRDLCRLGVKKLIIVDRDVVDDHNLNRQILFGKEHVGKSKVFSAAETLKQHSLRTEIVPVQLDAVKEWKKIVELARECTVIFQGIDVGDSFDLACQSLALSLQIPYLMAGTFQQMITVDLFLPKGQPCLICISDCKDTELKKKLAVDKIQSYDNLNFLPYDDHPVGASCVYVASTACDFMVSLWTQYLMGNPDLPTRLIFYYSIFDINKWKMEADSNCPMCSQH